MTSGDVSTHTLSLLSLFWSVWVQGLFLYLFILEHFGSGNFSLLIYFGALWSRCFPFALDMATCSVSFVLHQCHTQKYILTNSIFHTHNWQHSQQFGGFKLIASFTKSSIFLFNMSSSKLFSVSAHSILISISFTHLVISSTSQIKRMRGFSQPVVSGTICLSKCVIIKKTFSLFIRLVPIRHMSHSKRFTPILFHAHDPYEFTVILRASENFKMFFK